MTHVCRGDGDPAWNVKTVHAGTGALNHPLVVQQVDQFRDARARQRPSFAHQSFVVVEPDLGFPQFLEGRARQNPGDERFVGASM